MKTSFDDYLEEEEELDLECEELPLPPLASPHQHPGVTINVNLGGQSSMGEPCLDDLMLQALVAMLEKGDKPDVV